MAYTSDKKPGGLTQVTSLGDNDNVVVDQSGDVKRATLTQLEGKMFDGKNDASPVTGTEVVVVRKTDNTIGQVALNNIVRAGLITNAMVSDSAAIADTKLATIATAGKVSNSATTATNANTPSAIVSRDSGGNFTAGTITATLSGNASTATTLQIGRTISLTDDVTYTSPSFDGSGNVTAAATISNNAITTAKILDANVTTAKIADANVTTAKIADGNVTTAKIADANVTTAKIADDTITNAKIASGVDAGKLTTGTLPAGRIGSSAITTDRINNGAVTAGKLSTGAVGTGVGFVREAASNYIIMQGPNGTKVGYAWGVTSSTQQQMLTTVNFPITFSAAPSVTATVSSILFGFGRMVSTGTVSTTNFTYQVRNDAGGAESNPINWIAIGPVA